MATYKLADLDQWAAKIGMKAQNINNNVCFALSDAVIEQTPVWRGEGKRGGTARGNWQPTLNGAAQGILDFQDEVGAATKQKAKEISNSAAQRGGTARGNWQASLHSPAQGTLDMQDESGATTKQKAKQVSNSAAENVFYLTNNLPYIRVLEYGLYPQGAYKTERTKGGYSVQAPHGMVRIAAREFSRTVKEQVNKFK